MPDVITSGYVTEMGTMHNMHPWAWLLRLDVDGTNGFFLAGHDADVVFGGNTYKAFPIAVGALPRDAEGDLPIVEISLSNVGREAATYLEAGGVIDRPCHLRLVNTNQLASAIDWGEWTVQDAQLSLTQVTLRVGPYNLFEAPLPARRQNRNRCDCIYGGLECQYDPTLPNLIAGTNPLFDRLTCDFTLNGANGCRVHGVNEVACGKPRKHPGRFGGHPGIPKGPART